MAPFERRLFTGAAHLGVWRLALVLTALVGVLGMHGLPGHVAFSAPQSMTAEDHLVPALPDQLLASSPAMTTVGTADHAMAGDPGPGGAMEDAPCLSTEPRSFSPPSPAPAVLAHAPVGFLADAPSWARIGPPRIQPGVDLVALCVSLS